MTYHVEILDTGEHQYCARALIRDGRRVVGEVHWSQGYNDPDEAKHKAEAIARAYCFAAAPDMLAALKDFVTETRAYSSPECDENEITGPLLQAADAAIAKAEG